MGIKQLMKLIADMAPGAIRKLPIEHYTGRIIAWDASMAIYQFLIATQFTYKDGGPGSMVDEAGNPTAHLVGLFNRTIQFIEHGIKPIWVFDGEAPLMKQGTLDERRKTREEASVRMEEAMDEGNMEEVKKQAGRRVKVTPEMIADAKRLLVLMGVPVVDAPTEAEAQWAAMVMQGKAFAVASEDMDSLTFQAKFLLRGFNSKKEPITEISYDEMIRAFDLTHQEFVDLWILCGCDYTKHIDGIGPTTAFKLISQHSSIENIVEFLTSQKSKKVTCIPEDFNYIGARGLFMNPHVDDLTATQFIWNAPNETDLHQFLITEKQFNVNRVESGIKRMKNNVGKPLQSKLESFFNRNAPILKKPPPGKGKTAEKQKKSTMEGFFNKKGAAPEKKPSQPAKKRGRGRGSSSK